VLRWVMLNQFDARLRRPDADQIQRLHRPLMR
jgi:hypothetical protein